MKFSDGDFPNRQLISNFMNIVNSLFSKNEDGDKKTNLSSEQTPCIAVHCIAGLGRYIPFYIRAPVLVAIALIEIGMDKHAAIQLIRHKRKGALNMKQMENLLSYRTLSSNGDNCCIGF
jgi:protein tyrosine phosphatase type 4A